MPVSMHTVSIPIFIQHLKGLNAVLDKAAAWAAARKVEDSRRFMRSRWGLGPMEN